MKGYLSFLMLWMLNRQKMNGAMISEEIAKRKGSRPSPGTIYPALKDLKKKGLIKEDKSKNYSLTQKGSAELEANLNMFMCIFSDYDEMKRCCHSPRQ